MNLRNILASALALAMATCANMPAYAATSPVNNGLNIDAAVSDAIATFVAGQKGTVKGIAVWSASTGRFWDPVSDQGAVNTGGATPFHATSTASTNCALVSTGPHTLYSLVLTGLNTTAGYVRLYDTAGVPTPSSATGAVHSLLVIGSATAQGGLVVPIPDVGEAYLLGLAYCITGGSADTDASNGPVGILVNGMYK